MPVTDSHSHEWLGIWLSPHKQLWDGESHHGATMVLRQGKKQGVCRQDMGDADSGEAELVFLINIFPLLLLQCCSVSKSGVDLFLVECMWRVMGT